jgi:mannose/fructose/N-acetylgalactosamine-specific phosphotransferase system component IID
LKELSKLEGTAEHILDKKTVNKVWFNYRMQICHVDNVERLQALGFCCAMAPALESLYPDDPERVKKGLVNHMQFFITENMIGGIIPGVVLSMEEQRAIQIRKGVPEDQQISDDLITSVKTGMMGPFAGIGDTLNYATIKPLMSTFFMGFAQQGQVWAPIVDDVLLYAFLVTEGKFMYNLGYKLGTESATEILKNNSVQKIITFFSIVGLFVMGIMAAQNVSVQFAFNIPHGTEYVSFQETLVDAIAPGLLPLLTVFGVYNYLKKGGTILKATLILLLVAVVLGGLGVLSA